MPREKNFIEGLFHSSGHGNFFDGSDSRSTALGIPLSAPKNDLFVIDQNTVTVKPSSSVQSGKNSKKILNFGEQFVFYYNWKIHSRIMIVRQLLLKWHFHKL